MRILLDENFPLDFAKLLVANEVTILHVHSLGWSGIKNGDLLPYLAELIVEEVKSQPVLIKL
jgi:hypothetical protein